MSVSTFSGLAGYTGVARSTSVSPFSSVVANTGLPTTNLLALHYADSGVTLNGSNAASVADLSGNGYTISNAAGSGQPLVTTDGLGRPVLRFNGTSHYLKNASITTTIPFTFYLSVTQNSWSPLATLADFTNGGGESIYQNGASPDLYAAGNSGGVSTPIGSPPIGAVSIICVVWNGASSSFAINGATPTTCNLGTTGGYAFTLGAIGSGTDFAGMDLYGDAIYAATHDAATQQQVYLALKARLRL